MSNEFQKHFVPENHSGITVLTGLQATLEETSSFQKSAQIKTQYASEHLIESGTLSDLKLVASDGDRSRTGTLLKGHISNIPEVSQGIHTFVEAKALGDSIAKKLNAIGSETLNFLATPYAVNESIIGLGPILDTAVNYYANTPAERVMRDVGYCAGSVGTSLYENLSYPLTPQQRGEISGTLMPLFLIDGVSEAAAPLIKAPVKETIAESELSESGISRILRRAGKGGDWPVINERASADVIQQFRGDACVAAAGEMLSEGRLSQIELFEKVGTVPERLAEELGPEWKCKFVADREKAFQQIIDRKKPWGAELMDEFRWKVGMGHMVVVDGLDEIGNVVIRDSQHATKYEMTKEDFIAHWTGRAVWR